MQHPLSEYPRPALRRDSFESLNGPWQYAFTKAAQFPTAWDGTIRVPYSPEAPASGVGRTLQPGEWLHYHRGFTPPARTTAHRFTAPPGMEVWAFTVTVRAS